MTSPASTSTLMQSGASLLAGTCSVLALASSLAGCSDDTTWDAGSGGSVAGALSAGGVTAGGSGGAGTTAGVSIAGGASPGGAGVGGAATGGAALGGGSSQYANFATVGEIITFKCGGSGCHTEREPTLVADARLYTTLTTFVAKECGNRLLVKPGSPQESAFYLAQSGLCGPELPQMPLGCVDNCTPPEYVEGVRQWIANGAPQQ